MLSRSVKSRLAKARFYTAKNQIDVFFEDTSPSSIIAMRNMIRRSPQFAGKVHEPFPIGDKAKVIEAWNHSKKRPRKTLFIVDGDFDIWDGTLVPKPRLYVLNAYCMENIFVDENAILKILESDLVMDAEKIAKKLEFDKWKNQLCTKLMPLFVEYYYCKRRGTETNVKNGVHPFMERGKFKKTLITAQTRKYRLINKSRATPIERKNLMASLSSHLPEKLICGKTHMFPLLIQHIKDTFKQNNRKNESWEIAVSNFCDVTEIDNAYAYVV